MCPSGNVAWPTSVERGGSARPRADALRALLLVGCALSIVSPIGCGPPGGIKRVVVSGRVSYQGQPVADGTVTFMPIKGTKGPAASATIEDGVYKVSVGGGVPAGVQRVEIQAFHPAATIPNRPPSLQDLPAKQQYLPSQYNRQSTLEVTVSEQTVQTRDFDLK
jgi:hypothetical protein